MNAGPRAGALVCVLVLAACSDGPSSAPRPSSAPAPPSAPPAPSCAPTFDDGLSPSYRPNAPERATVGHGHVLTGTVRSTTCEPIAGVTLELWVESPEGGHPDALRATLRTATDGAYRFECPMTDHVHMRISAPGYRTLASNRYHPEGRPTGTFDIVLAPEP